MKAQNGFFRAIYACIALIGLTIFLISCQNNNHPLPLLDLHGETELMNNDDDRNASSAAYFEINLQQDGIYDQPVLDLEKARDIILENNPTPISDPTNYGNKGINNLLRIKEVRVTKMPGTKIYDAQAGQT